MIQTLNTEDFKTKIFDYTIEKEWIFKGDRPCIIKFGADWCQPCRILETTLKEISEENNTFDIYLVDVDKDIELAAVFGVRSVPLMMFIPVNGEPQVTIGALPKVNIIEAANDLFK